MLTIVTSRAKPGKKSDQYLPLIRYSEPVGDHMPIYGSVIGQADAENDKVASSVYGARDLHGPRPRSAAASNWVSM